MTERRIGGSLILHRREVLIGGAATLLLATTLRPALALADDGWNNVDVTGTSAPLQFRMTRAQDGKVVTQADYRGDVTMLYFGYTYCPDVCPLTLSNVAKVLHALGPDAKHVRMLFVTVDPNRDTLNVLKQYTSAFGPQFVGLRGSPDELAKLARRYRVAYSVTPASSGHPYEVTHSSVIYAFDQTGAARLLIPSMSSRSPDINGTAADLRRLIAGQGQRGIISRMMHEALSLV